MTHSLLLAALAVLVAAPLTAQTPLTRLTTPSDATTFGWSVAVSGTRTIVGDRVANGGAGAATVFAYDGAAWREEARLTGSANVFGWDVAILGDRAVVTARGAAAYVFAFDGTTWVQQAVLTPSDGNDEFGSSVSLSGDRALIGASVCESTSTNQTCRSVGSAYVFAFDGTTWAQEAKLTASDGFTYDFFGYDVSISGNRALIGAAGTDFNRGSAYVFEHDGTRWTQRAKLRGSQIIPHDRFGISVSITGNRALVGADEAVSGGNGGGGAYVFEYDGSSWVERQLLRPSDRPANSSDRANGMFGISVALSGNEALIGSQFSATDVNGPGAAYRFTRTDGVWNEQERLAGPNTSNNTRFGYAVSLAPGVGVVGAFGDRTAGNGAAYVYGEPVVRPDPLSLRLLADPEPIRSGDPFTVTLEVTNDSDAPITALTPELTLTLNGDADARFTGGPTPASVASLAPGASATLAYTLDASGGAGSARFSATVEGRDATGETVRAERIRTIPFENPALAARLVATPSSPRAGNAFEVAVTVENISDTPLRNVRPLAPPTITTTPAIASTLDAGPTPAGPVTLAVGASQTFRYTVTAAEETSLRFSVRFGGDTEAGVAVSSVQAVETIEVRPAQTVLAELVAFRNPTDASPTPAGADPTFTGGERFLVRLVVTNDLEVAVSGLIAPSPLDVAGEGGLTLVSGPTPAGPVTLQPGDNEFFDYVFEAVSQGEIQFSAEVMGQDPDGQDVPSNTAMLDAKVRVYTVSITSASGPRPNTGLKPSSFPDDIRFVRYEDTEAGRRPVCESGCADLIIRVRDQAGEPVEDEEIWAKVNVTGTPLAGVDGGYFCERVVLGQAGECQTTATGSLMKLTTDADGQARIWVAFQAADAKGSDGGRELVAKVAFESLDIDDPDAELTLPVTETLIADLDDFLTDEAGLYGVIAHAISTTAGAVSIGEYCESFFKWSFSKVSDAVQYSQYQQNVLQMGFSPIVVWTCDAGVALVGLAGPIGLALAAINTVGDATKKFADAAQFDWFINSFGNGIGNGADLIVVNGPLPPPFVYWVRGDVLDVADEVAGIAAVHSGAGTRHQISTQEVSGIPRPLGATSENDFDASRFNGQLQIRYQSRHGEVEATLSDGYTPIRGFLNPRSVITRGYLVDNPNVGTGSARLASNLSPDGAMQRLDPASGVTTAAVAQGATAVRLDVWDGAVGDYVMVGRGSDVPEIVQVLAVEAPAEGSTGDVTLTVTTPLRYAHTEGAVVRTVFEGTLSVPAPPMRRPHLGTEPPTSLAWFSVPTSLAASYALQVATDTTAGALALVLDETDLTGDSLIVDPALFDDGTTYSWRVRATNGVGMGPWSQWQSFRPGSGVATEADAPVTAVALGTPFPNPARSASATVSVEMPEAGAARLAVYDALGRVVVVAHDGPLAAGRHAVSLDTARLPAGVYLVRLDAGGAAAVQRLTVVR